MFFTSYTFVFLFVPLAWAGFALLLHQGRQGLATGWLVAMSLWLYASLDARHLPQLVGSVLVNYAVIVAMARAQASRPRLARALLMGGVAFNIGLLAWLKYAGLLWGDGTAVAIPLGISFYTLQQIGFLIASFHARREGPPGAARYALFVGFFPYVIAGPVVTRQEMLGQFAQLSLARARAMALPSLTLFSLGLFKKVGIADTLGVHVDAVFLAAGNGAALSAADAWGAALLYTLQIYFDFSGYSDMAAGLAGLFGLQLPRNFHSPFKARSIMEFWRRWHMSATRFFTNHVYLPLVLTAMRRAVKWRLGGATRYGLTVLLPMLVTFMLIGLWHGAGVTAVVFGLMMGAAISLNHLWVQRQGPRLPALLGWGLTMAVVVCGMVFSRSDTMSMAHTVFVAMAGVSAGGSALLDPVTTVGWVLFLGAACLLAPNTHEIMDADPVVLPETWSVMPAWQQRFAWRQGHLGALFASAAFCTAAVLIPKASQFIYYRF